jgi:hypothetical protein
MARLAFQAGQTLPVWRKEEGHERLRIGPALRSTVTPQVAPTSTLVGTSTRRSVGSSRKTSATLVLAVE